MINQDFNALGSFDHDPEIGGDHEPTAPNTPTPELERYEPNTYKNSVFSMARHKDGDYVLHSEAAAAIANLTAERDAALASRDRWKSVCVPERVLELEAAEASNKLLEAGLQRLASPEAFTVPRMANDEEQARMHYADDVLRRALAAQEAK